ncbi:MAG: hypothetical protein K6E79_04005 [Pseudobutyrivibrio sp.]|nr:hypothetical protein [Pseudobutyrivibrio sp.]
MTEKYKDTEQEAVNKTLAGEKKKLAQMSFKEKVDYIFTYYKIHIIGALIVIALIIYIIYQRMNYTTYRLYGVVINSSEVNENLTKTLPDTLGMEAHDGVSLIAGLSGDVDSNSISYYNQIDLYTVSGQMDFAFTDEEGVQYLCDLGTPLDVTQVLPENLAELWKNRETQFSQRNENDETYFDNYAAIDISDTAIPEYFGLDDNMSYLVITDLSNNQEYMDAFYQLLYDIDTGNVK